MRGTRPAGAAVALALLLAATASAQIRVGHRTGGTTTGGTIGRGTVEPDPAAEKKRMEEGCRRYLAKGEESFEQKQYAKANRNLRRAKGLLVTRELAERAVALGRKLNEVGMQRLAEGDKAFAQKDYPAAVKTYRATSLIFAGLPAAQAAAKRLAEVKNDPEVADARAERTAARLMKALSDMLDRRRRGMGAQGPTTRPAAATQPTLADDRPGDIEVIFALNDRDLLYAADILQRLTTEHAATPTGQEAAGLLETLSAEPQWSRRVQELQRAEEARKELAKADAYCNAGLLAKAAEMYQQVIQKYPKSAQATEAARQLGIIQAKKTLP